MVAVAHPDYTARGEANGRSLLTEAHVECIRELRRLGYSAGAIARRFDISERQVREVVAGRQWAHVPGVPRNACASCWLDVDLNPRKLCSRCASEIDTTRRSLAASGVVPPRRGVTTSEAQRMRELRDSGYSVAQIASVMGRGASTVTRHAGLGLPAGIPGWVAAICGRTGETPEEVYARHQAKRRAEGVDDAGR